MKNDKSKNIIIALLVVIIIILGALIVLFVTDTIGFNSNEIDTNNTQENSSSGNEQNNENVSNENQKTDIVGVYSGWNFENPVNSITLILFSDDKFNMCIGYMCSDGRYVINDQKLLLTTNTDEVNPAPVSITYTFESDKTNLISDNKTDYCDLKNISILN